MQYFEAGGWWLPDHEKHLQEYMLKTRAQLPGKKLGYQFHKYEMAIRFVKNREIGKGIAVDIGAHVGTWSWPLSFQFAEVHAFEPMPEHQECWRKNMESRNNAKLYPYALGNKEEEVVIKVRPPGSPGDEGNRDQNALRSSLRAAVYGLDEADGGFKAKVRRLDDFHFKQIDFLKVDCEGFELYVLQGGEDTLLRCKPTVMIEAKKATGVEEHYGIDALESLKFLESLGSVQRTNIQGDWVYSWD